MNMQRAAFGSIGALLLLSTASFASEVKTDYDRGSDFGQYKTYSWENVQTKDPLLVDRIKAAVNSALSARGWKLVESGGDVSVLAMEINRNHRTLNTYYNSFGGGWRWGGGFGTATTTVNNYRVGTLVVDLFDAKSKKLVWRGSSSDTLSKNSNKNIKAIDKGAEKMFEHFPPVEKK